MGSGLEQLRDIHVPPAAGWWPPAPGYWLLIVLAATILAAWLWRHRRYRLRRLAMHEVELAIAAYQSHQDDKKLAVELSALLRRIAISFQSRKQAASALGKQWVTMLQTLPESPSHAFSDAVAEYFAVGVYRADVNIPVQQLIDECRRWVAALPKHEGST